MSSAGATLRNEHLQQLPQHQPLTSDFGTAAVDPTQLMITPYCPRREAGPPNCSALFAIALAEKWEGTVQFVKVAIGRLYRPDPAFLSTDC